MAAIELPKKKKGPITLPKKAAPVVAPEDVRDASGMPGGSVSLPPGQEPKRELTWRDTAEDFLKEFVVGPASSLAAMGGETSLSPLAAAEYITPTIRDDLKLMGQTFGLTDPDWSPAALAREKQQDAEYYAPVHSGRQYMYENLPEQSQTVEGKALTRGVTMLAGGAKPTRATELARGAGAKSLSYGADLIGNVVAPEIGQEAAGAIASMFTDDPKLQTAARILGAAGGNVATAASRAWNAPDQIVRASTRNVTEQQWRQAQDLIDRARARGVTLTGPQAMAQVTAGATPLTNALRVVEGNPIVGREITGPVFAQQAQDIDRATNLMFDRIAPQAPNPEVLAPRMSEAAQTVIDQTKERINQQTRPLYRAAEPDLIDPQDYAALAADPRYAAALDRLRNHPEIGPEYQGFPDNSVGVIDAVTKDLFERGEAASNLANPQYGPYLGSLQTQGASTARDTASRTSPNYAQALAEQQQLRRNELEPVERGTVGEVAKAQSTTGVEEALLPQEPRLGTGNQARDAIAAMRGVDAPSTAQTVRQIIGDRWSKALTTSQEGIREFAAGKFAKDIAGNPARLGRVEGLLSGLQNGPEVVNDFGDMLEIMQAAAKRKAVGSMTEFNRQLSDWLGGGSPRVTGLEMAGTLGKNYLTLARDAAKRAAMRSNVKDLAEMFVDPESVTLMRQAAARGPQYAIPETIARTGLQGLGLLYNQ